ncbi:MAG: type I DNA topoisomerase [Candidatus Aminicenantes bacterium]|nr:type I DNA topoisomerase [Candidatus Aminicenantes bacterium]
MQKSLVIVESPAKAKTVNRYLGSQYIVKASMGHVRDLPKTKLGVDIAKDFEPTYQVIPDKKKVVEELRHIAGESERVILAADPDREGEAISWHLSQLIAKENPHIFRAVFDEITEEGIQKAFARLGELDKNMIEAQQTRRILDRLMGYLISPLLWKKIGKGLSAGRVQSVALRLIVDREREIKAFVPEEYWTIAARLEAQAPPPFKASLTKIDGKKTKVRDAAQAQEVVAACRETPFILERVKVQEKRKSPAPPYITSTLQQDAFRVLRNPVKKTMFVAQKLYEGLPVGDLGPTGLITYMRTDSFRIAEEAQAAARKHITQTFGPEYLPAKPNVYKNKKKAQDAHEAIRPAHLDFPPERVKPFLKKEEFDLYRLIWNRFVASQMAPAVVEETEFDIRSGRYGFMAKGAVIRFKGFLAALPGANGGLTPKKAEPEREPGVGAENGDEEAAAGTLPPAKEGETLKLLDLESKQKFTEPPPRYTEGTLVKELEARGIGRPSTYQPTLATLQTRKYVLKEEGRFVPTEVGIYVTDFLVKHFHELLEYKFTAHMEDELDEIGDGERGRLEALREFYGVLDGYLKAGEGVESVKKNGIPVDEKCPKCGKDLVIKEGRFGRFKACSGYPDCKFRESLVKKETKMLDEKCPECGSPLVLKRGRYGAFVACSSYPKCKYIKKERQDTGIACPLECGGTLLRRKTKRGKFFYGCSSYPKCKFASWDEPVVQACPQCGRKVIFRKSLLRGEPYLYCKNEKCTYKEKLPREPEPGGKSDAGPGTDAALEPGTDKAKEGKPGPDAQSY